jgi:PAS domain S-box-containing protein
MGSDRRSQTTSTVPGAAEHLAAIVASSTDAIISKDLDGIVTSWNLSAERLFGYTADEMIGRSILLLIPPERHSEEPGILQRIRNGERIEHFETIRRRKDGSLFHISITVSPIKNAAGEIIGASKIARDITEQKRAEEARELLLNEIKHRVKNTLGTVQAIATQTFRTAPRAERAAFTARLHALADAHDVLTQRSWLGASVRELFEPAIAAFRQHDRERVAYNGPEVEISPTNALLLAMIVHELGTNAVKYGALSNDTGAVEVAWSLDAGGRRLRIVWRERGGPPVVKPEKRGFGTEMIERTLRGEQGSAHFDYAPSGLVCTLTMKI